MSPDTLKEPDWHGCGRTDPARRESPWLPWVLPPGMAVVLWFLGWRVAAMLVAGIGLTLAAFRCFSPVAKRRIDHALACFAEWVGGMVATALLAPPFFLFLPLLRLWRKLNGNDPLRLDPKWRESPGFWLAPDLQSRRKRVARRMFAAERLEPGGLRLLPLGLLLLGGLLVSELGLRLYGLGRPLLFVQDSVVAYYPAPNQKVRYPGRMVETNAQGMRCEDFAMPKPAGVFRILMTGDSTLAGTKVGNHELYSHLLEEKLNARNDGRTYEVLNLGVNAWGPHHQLGYVSKFGCFDADLAIICGPVANAYRPKYGLERLPFFPSTRAPKTAWGHVLHELMWRSRERTLGAPAWAVEGPVQDEQSRGGARAYATLAELYQEMGCAVMMEMLPARPVTLGEGEDPFGQRIFGIIRDGMRHTGVTPNLAGPVFKDHPQRGKIYYDGIHFDRLGHRLYAEYLYQRVVASGLARPQIR